MSSIAEPTNLVPRLQCNIVIVYCADQGKELGLAGWLSDAVFLLSANTVLGLDINADAVPAHFTWPLGGRIH
jgi:hypothetical protein